MKQLNQTMEVKEKMLCAQSGATKDITLKSLQDGIDSYRASVDKLGVVLEELVRTLDLDGSGIDAYILHYVADARESLRSILQLLEEN